MSPSGSGEKNASGVGTWLAPQRAGIPTPSPSLVSEPFWAGARAGELRYQWCEACGVAVMDPQPACPRCLGSELEWRVSSGRGTVSSFTVVWRAPLPAFQVPYAPAIVEMAEGFTLLTNVINCEVDQLKVGLPVEAVFVDIEQDVSLIYVQPDEANLAPGHDQLAT